MNIIFKCFYFQAYSGIFVNIVKTKGYFFLSDVMCVSEKSYFKKKKWPNLSMMYSKFKLCIQNNLPNITKVFFFF